MESEHKAPPRLAVRRLCEVQSIHYTSMSADNVSANPGASAPQADPADETPRTNSAQDEIITNKITETGQLINRALANPEIVGLLAKRGYDEAELRVGLGLQEAAMKGFVNRQSSRGPKGEAKQKRDDAWKAAKAEFTDYRGTVQDKYRDAATRTALGANGSVSGDLQKFVTQATAAYTTALASPQAGFLAKRSFTAERLNAALAALGELTELDDKFAETKGAAQGGTGARNKAVAAMDAWLAEFRNNARRALAKQPAHLATLGL